MFQIDIVLIYLSFLYTFILVSTSNSSYFTLVSNYIELILTLENLTQKPSSCTIHSISSVFYPFRLSFYCFNLFLYIYLLPCSFIFIINVFYIYHFKYINLTCVIIEVKTSFAGCGRGKSMSRRHRDDIARASTRIEFQEALIFSKLSFTVAHGSS